LVFIGDKKSKNLNQTFRKKNYSANVLSFPIDKNFGEIFINFPSTKKECKKFDRKTENFIDFLFVHGLAHLKGDDHINDKDSEKMEKFEEKNRKKFSI
jgi:probable rRNA maturation factor